MDFHHGGWHFFGMDFGWILLVVIVLAIIGALTAVMRRGNSSQESPEEILKRRYACGEISQEEFHKRMEDLKKNH